MTDTTAGGATVPDTKPYRVVIVGASYLSPEEGFAADGTPTIVQVYKIGRQGDIIQLTEAQANRLVALGAVKEADAPATYSELGQDALQAQADERGINVRGSGVNGEVIREDLVSALENYDRAVNSRETALVAADAGAPVVSGSYQDASRDELQAEADRRGLTVQGTGANGNVLKEDLVAALEADDARRGAESV